MAETTTEVDQRQHYRADGTPKKGYEFIGDARQASAVHFTEGDLVLPYKCDVCGLYHLGHQPNRLTAAQRRALGAEPKRSQP